MEKAPDILSQLIVVSDLDGTLLDHHTYGYEPARPALDCLAALEVPLILSSSKTASEMAEIRGQLGLDTPFISENGACVHLPGAQGEMDRIAFSMPRTEILTCLEEIKRQTRFRYSGFAEMSVDELVRLTGLSREQAANAKDREFTEPLAWHDSAANLSTFRTLLVRRGLNMVRGGRFLHVMGQTHKGDALRWLRDYFSSARGHPTMVLALGDSENDIEMLEAADYAVVVRSPVRPLPGIDHPRYRITTATGPEGWNQAVLELLGEWALAEPAAE